MTQDISYSVVVTSCKRFDLLRQSLSSLASHLDVAPVEWILVEDSDDDACSKVLEDLGIKATVIVNGSRLGQIQSIDRAYNRVRTPYIFHCEDDWHFFRSGFVRESWVLLERLPDISMVGLRSRAEQNPRVRNMPALTLEGIGYFVLDPALHPEYFSYSFNPGLRRTADYHRLGPFVPLGHEPDISYAFKKQGFSIANLEVPAVGHIGDGRHVNDPTQPVKARTVLQKLARSARKRLKRIKRLFHPLAPAAANWN